MGREGGVTRGAREGGEPGAISSGSQSEGLERLAEELKVIIGGLGVSMVHEEKNSGLALTGKEALYVWRKDPGDNRCPFSRSSCSPTRTEHKRELKCSLAAIQGRGHQLSTRTPESLFVLLALLSPALLNAPSTLNITPLSPF